MTETPHTADTEDDCTCGRPHAHKTNPYTDAEREAAYRTVVTDLFRLGTLTCQLDPRLTATYSACVLTSLIDMRDPVPTFRALAWEIARLCNIMSGPGTPGFIRHGKGRCDDPSHDHAEELENVAEFMTNALEAFFTAASAGQFESAVSIVEAVNAEVHDALDGSPSWGGGAAFFANLMISMSTTAHKYMPNALDMYTD